MEFSLHFAITNQTHYPLVRKWQEGKTQISLQSTFRPFTEYLVSGSSLQAGASGEKTKRETNVFFGKASWQQCDMERSPEPEVRPLPISTEVTLDKSINFPVPQLPSLVKRERQPAKYFTYEDHIIRAVKNL